MAPPENTYAWIEQQARRLGHVLPGKPPIWHDTTNFMSIERDHVVVLDNEFYLIRGNEHEGRFGIDDQPKFWVKRAVDLRSGTSHILKLVCQEEFKISVGSLPVRCIRSAGKEGRVLDLVRGDARFMQGHTARDVFGNLVRVIEFIPGVDLLSFLHSMHMDHEEYVYSVLPDVLPKITDSLDAIQRLHDARLCHGDIRNDHLLVERGTGRFRWIDFDLDEDCPEFDIWSIGNVLHCVAAKGFVTFREALQADSTLSGQLYQGDASVFFPYRVMNLRKVYPYLPEGLNNILMRFSVGSKMNYAQVADIVADLKDCIAQTERKQEATPKDSPAASG